MRRPPLNPIQVNPGEEMEESQKTSSTRCPLVDPALTRGSQKESRKKTWVLRFLRTIGDIPFCPAIQSPRPRPVSSRSRNTITGKFEKRLTPAGFPSRLVTLASYNRQISESYLAEKSGKAGGRKEKISRGSKSCTSCASATS